MVTRWWSLTTCRIPLRLPWPGWKNLRANHSSFTRDLLDGDLLDRIFGDHTDIAAVIHFAALKAVGESTTEPLRYYRNNVSGTVSLLEAMDKAEVKNIVFSSSCTVYGEPEEVPILESHSTGGVSSPYGRTKHIVEEILADQAVSNPGFKAAVFATSILWGLTRVEKSGKIPMEFPIIWFLSFVRLQREVGKAPGFRQ